MASAPFDVTTDIDIVALSNVLEWDGAHIVAVNLIRSDRKVDPDRCFSLIRTVDQRYHEFVAVV